MTGLSLIDCDRPMVYQEPRPADVRRHIASIFLAGELVDFSPRVSLEEGIELTIEWYKSTLAVSI